MVFTQVAFKKVCGGVPVGGYTHVFSVLQRHTDGNHILCTFTWTTGTFVYVHFMLLYACISLHFIANIIRHYIYLAAVVLLFTVEIKVLFLKL